MKSIRQIDRIRILLMLLIVGGTCGGISYGYLLARATAIPPTPMQWVEEVSYHVPMLTLEGYSDTEMVWKTGPIGLRFILGEDILSAPPETLFRLPLPLALKEEQASSSTGTELPGADNCPFVAGTTGKYVYPQDDARAKRLKTRRCFANQEEALAAGLLVPEK